MLGWKLVKYNIPRTQHDLYSWENTSDGASSEVDYITVRDMKIVPIECKDTIRKINIVPLYAISNLFKE